MRYFFHVIDTVAVIDIEGLELSRLEDARKEALRASASLIGTADYKWSGDAWRMIVCDETGTIVFGTSFAVDYHGLAGKGSRDPVSQTTTLPGNGGRIAPVMAAQRS
jgi:hypothetical protein